MLFASWRRWIKRPGKPTPRPRRCLPRLECLEERAVPATFVVNTTIDEFDGTPANPAGPDHLLSLREAVAAANNSAGPNTILLPAGNFHLSPNDPLQATNALTIVGKGAALTVIEGNLGSNFLLSSPAGQPATFSFSNLTITGAVGTSNGGAIDLTTAGDNLTLTNVVITGSSTAFSGGGVYVAGGNVTLSGSTISNNSAALNGGGLANHGTGSSNGKGAEPSS